MTELGGDPTFAAWLESLEQRFLADLSFPEVARALRALSSAYVERRHRLATGAALDGAGKRAAFALYYGPLHFLLVDHVVGGLPGSTSPANALIDLGCGTGAAGAAWARRFVRPPAVTGVDRHPWALQEAARTYRAFEIRARTDRVDLGTAPLRGRGCVIAAFAINELPDAACTRLLPVLLARAAGGDRILVVEPLARAVAPWWDEWRRQVEAIGGRADEHRFRPTLPPLVTKLDHAAGLDHRELTCRTLWLNLHE